ncbi:MAG: helix-turn-helix domain-containing protein [Bacteriovoracaceae bacterium]|nr:helix-turn-helix domain-containing protein [Bacteriovoracaceae bacterium]
MVDSKKDQEVNHEMCVSEMLFNNLIWLTTEEAARYLRKTANAVRIMVYKKILRPRKFRRRLYFKKDELELLIETAGFKNGGLQWQ